MTDRGYSVVGYKAPRFDFFLAGNVLYKSIPLDLTDSGGLIEEYKDEAIERIILDYSAGDDENPTIYRDILDFGMWFYFTLSYARYGSEQTHLNIGEIRELLMRRDLTCILTPRTDANFADRIFEVVKDVTKTMQLGVKRGGKKNRGNKLLVLPLVTKRTHKSFYWKPGNNAYVHAISDWC